METSFPTTDRYGFPVEVCGRCGGTGQHSYNQMHGSVCYGCDGKQVRHTKKARPQFQAWAGEVRKQQQAVGHAIQVGDELAVHEGYARKIVGWRSVVAVETTEDACGWSIERGENGEDIKTPTAWGMLITFDDGEVERSATNNCYRRRGWIDPVPYVTASQPGRRRKAA